MPGAFQADFSLSPDEVEAAGEECVLARGTFAS
jgi:hypothetical protein